MLILQRLFYTGTLSGEDHVKLNLIGLDNFSILRCVATIRSWIEILGEGMHCRSSVLGILPFWFVAALLFTTVGLS